MFSYEFCKVSKNTISYKQLRGCFCKVFFKFSQISQGSLFNIVAVLRLWPWDFPVKFAKFLRTAILKNICQWLLLNISKRRLHRRCSHMNFVNYSRTFILKSTYKRMVLKHQCDSFSLIKLQAWWSGGL